MMKFAVTLLCTLLLIASMVQAESGLRNRDVYAVEDEFGAARRGLFDHADSGKGSKKMGKGGKGGSKGMSSGKAGKGGSKGMSSGKGGKGSKKMGDSGKGGKGGMSSGKGSKKMGKGGKGTKKMGKGGKGSKKDKVIEDFEDMVFGSMSM